MYRLLAAFLPFIKELFFERKEEMDFSSYKFNAKKWLQYVLFLGLIVLAMFMGGRLLSLSSRMIVIKQNYHKLEELERKDTEQIKSLQDKLDDLQEQNNQLQIRCLLGKNQSPQPIKLPRPTLTVKKSEVGK